MMDMMWDVRAGGLMFDEVNNVMICNKICCCHVFENALIQRKVHRRRLRF